MMAKTEKKAKKGNFISEVKQEVSKVTWPTRKETLASLVMVLIISALAAVFFLLVDAIISSLVQWVLGF